MPLRFAITSRPSRCEEDLHLLADKHARHTIKRASVPRTEALAIYPGGDLRSHAVTRAVSSAQRGLTSVFGMGTGVTLAV